MILACGKWSSRLSAVYKKATVNVYRLTVEFENPARPNRTTFLGVNTQQHFLKNQKKKVFFLFFFSFGILIQNRKGGKTTLVGFQIIITTNKKVNRIDLFTIPPFFRFVCFCFNPQEFCFFLF